ncbi:MAG TPA: CpsD/CapB family tyrosine-protein kinase [Solirubrobacteraceae bacterium]
MATDPQPAFAADLANTIAEQYIEFRRAADRSKITDAITLVRRQFDALNTRQRDGPEGRSAKERVQQLETLASLQTGNAELVQPAEAPRTASSPKTVRNTISALLLGLLIGALVAVLLDRIDRRLRHRNDAEGIFERPILGAIPESRALRKTKTDGLHLGGVEGEAFRALRTNLRYFAIDQDVKSMLITSSAPGDGKSTIARYLAATSAASGVRVILIEADLRRPVLQDALPMLEDHGLTDVLAGDASLTDVIQQVSLQVPGRGGGDEPAPKTLDVMTAGPIPPNPTDLLESDRMNDLLAELEVRYDLVIIDSSPLTVLPDAVPLAHRVSGVVIVIREGKSTSAGARNLRKQLDNLQITPLGIIINASSPTDDGGYYGYYGYGTPQPAAVAQSTNGSGASRRPGKPHGDETKAR